MAQNAHRRSASWLALVAVLLSRQPLDAQKFYPDDPLVTEPAPVPVFDPQVRQLSGVLELVANTLGRPGERHPANGVIGAGGVNTLGEVLDGPWFVNRHAKTRLTPDALVRGAGADHRPAGDGPLRVLALRPFGLRPSVLVADRRNSLYLLRFDPEGHPEMATGAEMVSSRILHAAGYHVAESYLLSFERADLVVIDGSEIVSSAGRSLRLLPEEIDRFLRSVATGADGRYRAVATYVDARWRELLGPYQVFGTRSDDPNDIVAHEHRRDLRGLFVLSAWINHALMRSAHTQDVLLDEDGVPRIRHLLVDLAATLGSGYRDAKRAWAGNDPMVDGAAALGNIAGLGVWTPGWMRARYPRLPAVGRFEADTFDPDRWTTVERLAPFENRLPDDEYWGAKIVMSFTDDDIRTLVGVGAYSDPAAADWISRTLIARRDRIGRTCFEKVLPLDHFRLEAGVLRYDDLALLYGFRRESRDMAVRWARLDNATGALTPLGLSSPSAVVPDVVDDASPGTYFAAILTADDPLRDVTVYLRTGPGARHAIVGLVRGWPGKVLVAGRPEPGLDINRFADLLPEQQRLYEPYALAAMAAAGRSRTTAEHFDAEAVADRTTYEAVTHAALRSRLTDAQGNELGRAFDLISSLERVAGQYDGRSGDQQFRIYAELKPGAVDVLERSRQFYREKENTVYHAGYPRSFRQTGKEPTMQFSVSEDGRRADIDVDYRSSKSPRALFNGHLTAANSDVRAGNNLERHNGRWSGLIGWWRDAFGRVTEGRPEPGDDALLAVAAGAEAPTPTPPDRPRGAPIAEPHDAVQEFLTDWLVRRNVDDALAFVSDRARACVNVDDDARMETLGADDARAELGVLMRYVVGQLGSRYSLTDAVDPVLPVRQDLTVVPQPYDGEFAMVAMTEAQADLYFCKPGREVTPGASLYAALLRFKEEGSAAFGLLWAREDDAWRLVSYQVFKM